VALPSAVETAEGVRALRIPCPHSVGRNPHLSASASPPAQDTLRDEMRVCGTVGAVAVPPRANYTKVDQRCAKFDRLIMTQTIGIFLDLLSRGGRISSLPCVGADLWPAIVLALGLLLLLLILPIALRLHRVSHQLRELSNVVQRQARAIERLTDLLNEDLAPAPPVFPFRSMAEDQSHMVQSGDGPVDLQYN
jgi:hypothetical protein